uniref:Uncharacterized protein n=1 Tax=Lactuca sativa TaxID=4236 RepID=A0A9R1UTV8_LACSA|nr:hypothetical protein LSAT_V11C800435410 [Lactuca sativa]
MMLLKAALARIENCKLYIIPSSHDEEYGHAIVMYMHEDTIPRSHNHVKFGYKSGPFQKCQGVHGSWASQIPKEYVVLGLHMIQEWPIPKMPKKYVDSWASQDTRVDHSKNAKRVRGFLGFT